MSIDHLKFWAVVFRFYSHVDFPGEEIITMRAEDTLEFSIDALKEAFKVYRKTPGNDFPPTSGQLIGIMDPISTSAGVDCMANELYEKIAQIGPQNNVMKKLSEFECKVVDRFLNGPNLIWECKHRATTVRTIKNAILAVRQKTGQSRQLEDSSKRRLKLAEYDIGE